MNSMTYNIKSKEMNLGSEKKHNNVAAAGD